MVYSVLTSVLFRLPWGVVPAQAGPVQYTGQPTGPNGQPAPRLLFPSAQPGPSPSPQGAKPTFPAYSSSPSVSVGSSISASATISAAPTIKKPESSSGLTIKLIHPDEDISLEEKRASTFRWLGTRKGWEAYL